MRVLLDQGVSHLMRETLEQSGHDVVHVREYDLHDADDDVIIARAADEGRIVVVIDYDFGSTLARSRAVKPSIVHLRLPASEWQTQRQAELLLFVLANYGTELEHGAIVTVRGQNSIWIRRLPIE